MISLEKFSAFLDDNLPEYEMETISKEIAKDDFLSSVVQANANTDVMTAFYSQDEDKIDAAIIDEDSFEFPNFDNSSFGEEKNMLSDIGLDSKMSIPMNEDLYDERHHMVAASLDSLPSSSQLDENIDLKHHDMKENVKFGYEPNYEDPNDNFDPNVYQGNQPICAIRSQQIIMRDYGISISQEELIEYAIKNEWYSPDPENGGTPRDATGNLLDSVGIETRRYDNASIFDIISELREGHRVIVSVDANELWVKNEPKLYKRLFGEISNRIMDKMDEIAGVQGANHALIVAGVNVDPSNPSDMHVVLIDSGSGQVCIEYPSKDFKNAWDDSHCHMVTTTKPAPYQYNYHTHQMEPSNFSTDFMPSMVTLPSDMQNELKLLDSYYAKYGSIEPEYDDTDLPIAFAEFTTDADEDMKSDVISDHYHNTEGDNRHADSDNETDDSDCWNTSLDDEDKNADDHEVEVLENHHDEDIEGDYDSSDNDCVDSGSDESDDV